MPSSQIARKKMLCVEPDGDTARSIAQHFGERHYWVMLVPEGNLAFEQLVRHAPEVVVLSLNLGAMSGLDLLERVRSMRPCIPPVPFIFLMADNDRERELRDRHLTAGDYVAKPVNLEALTATVTSRLAARTRSRTWPKRTILGKREVETLTWAARGKTSAEIAQILGLSKRTVDFHIDNARSKLGVATRIQAAIKAATAQLIQP
jgi:DNA-binding NarL/FixJ family response regulator